MAPTNSWSWGLTALLKRPITVPSRPTRNFSKFQATSPAGSTWFRVSYGAVVVPLAWTLA